MYNVLIVEDHDRLREQLGQFYEQEGFRVTTACSGEEGTQKLAEEKFAIVVSDVKMPGMDGFQLARYVREKYPDTDVILITAFGNIKQAVEAMKLGASDYITKPFQPEAIRLVSEKLIEKRRLLEEVRELRQRVQEEHQLENILSKSPKMLKVFDLIRSLAETDSGVMITGETGTGKELVARAIHNLSRRKTKQFVAINCGAFPDTLLESELFGYEKGAFTGAQTRKKGRFELADGGTLFLDEIGDLDLTTQVKLLRVLQEREFERLGGVETIKVNVRLIVATNKNLEEAIKRSQFREDLYYRLNVFTIFMPPLRERKPDVLLLAEHFVEKFEREHSKSIKRISTPAIDMLTSYHWPGNVRELENVIERAVLICDSNVIHGHHLPPSLQTAEGSDTVTRLSLASAMEAYERDLIQDALKTSRGNRAKAAKLLDSTERIIGYKVKKYGLRCERFRS